MPQYDGTAAVTIDVAGVSGNFAVFSGGYNGSSYLQTTSSYSVS